MRKDIKILTAEDSPEDLDLILKQLEKDEVPFSFLNVETKEDFIKGLPDYNPDIVLADYSLPEFDGLAVIELIKNLYPHLPVIIVSGSNIENEAVQCIKKGADDYILKNNLSRLGVAVNGALENKTLRIEKDLNEKKILKLNRIYAVIGQTNEMIVRVRDKEKLFEEACKIAVETGKYRLVWVGLVDEKNKVILPHVWNGFEDGFLEEINKMPVEDILRNDPIQTRILMGSYFVCNNIIEEDSGFILRKNGLAHGFHSLISLPLTLQNKVIGSFNIYSDEMDFFTEDEIKLLLEVAGDISYALENISQEREKTISELRYRRLFESAKDGIIILNAENGEIVDVNPFITNNLDYLKEDLIGRQLWEIGFLKDSIFNKDSFLELLEHEYIRYEDLPLRKKDGSSLDVEFVSNVYWVDNEKVIQCNIRDITARKKSENSLSINETLLNTVVQTIPEIIWLKNVDGVYLSCNKMFERFFGAKEADIVGKTDFDFVDKEIAESYREHDRNAIAAGKPTSNEESITFADDGHVATMDTIKTPMYDARGTLIGVLGIARDMTERKKSEDLLRESEEKYRLLSESSHDAIYLVGKDGFMIYINNIAAQNLNSTPEEIIGKHITDIFSPDIAHQNLADMNSVITSKAPLDFEKEMQLPSGKIWLENRLSPVFNKENQVVAVFVLSINITKQKMAEIEFRKISSAVEQGPASVVITDRNGDIEYVNQKFCEITGYSKEEVIGKNPRFLSSGFHDKKFYDQLWSTLLTGNNWSGEIFNKKKNGELFWESALLSPLINTNGDITHFVAMKEDITEKKKMISELIVSKELAESANKLKDAFIANISHEIRTPLNGILGMTSLIKDSLHDSITKDDEELFEGIDLSSKRLIRTVDLILNYSRLQVGEYPIFRKQIELSSVCRDLVTEYALIAKNKFIELTFQNECEDTFIFADEYSIIMAISNIMGNAIKFSSRGFINLILHKNTNDEIILDVIDTGIGIGHDFLDKIFEPYLQENVGYSRAYDGVGLGLALVKKVLDLNNARVSVKSKIGEGTTFTINFGKVVMPVEEIIEQGRISEIPPVAEMNEETIVLIVEDEIINQKTIKGFLDKKYKSIITDSSNEAMKILKKEKIALILMDISIKGDMNGLELTKELKASKEFSHIPVIAVTAHVFKEDKQNAFEAGCENFLAKPFSKKEFLDMVDLYLIKPKLDK